MELLPISSPSAAVAATASARQAQVVTHGTDGASSSPAAGTVQVDTTRSQTVQKNERPAAQNADQTTLDNAGILFEYKEGQQVMKVNDSKGVLIYQVPPKGQLQLILEQEHAARMLETQA